jgi:hypothetical protein
MRLRFEPFDGRHHNFIPVVDEDTGNVVGHIQSDGVGFGNIGGIRVSLFDDKYSAYLNRYEECSGFVKGVATVLNHMTAVKQPAQTVAPQALDSKVA